MFWVGLFAAWGGFLLGVVFMAVLFMAREREPKGESQKIRPEEETSSATREGKIRVSHG